MFPGRGSENRNSRPGHGIRTSGSGVDFQVVLVTTGNTHTVFVKKKTRCVASGLRILVFSITVSSVFPFENHHLAVLSARKIKLWKFLPTQHSHGQVFGSSLSCEGTRTSRKLSVSSCIFGSLFFFFLPPWFKTFLFSNRVRWNMPLKKTKKSHAKCGR